jgi:hypothetical protein
LDIEQGLQRDAGNPAMLMVLYLAVEGVSKGGAEYADGVFPVALDFKVDWMAAFDG